MNELPKLHLSKPTMKPAPKRRLARLFVLASALVLISLSACTPVLANEQGGKTTPVSSAPAIPPSTPPSASPTSVLDKLDDIKNSKIPTAGELAALGMVYPSGDVVGFHYDYDENGETVSGGSSGTITYVTENGEYGANAHAMLFNADDSYVGKPFSVSMKDAVVLGVESCAGDAGMRLLSIYGADDGDVISSSYEGASMDTFFGVFGGSSNGGGTINHQQNAVEIGWAEVGVAQVLTSLDNEQPKLYDIEITDVSYSQEFKQYFARYKITDARAIELLHGGEMAEGLSGSPILQNGRLVAAASRVEIGQENSPNLATMAYDMLKAHTKVLDISVAVQKQSAEYDAFRK